VYKQILINKKLKTGNGDQQTELTERSPFGKLRSTLDCSTIPSKKKNKNKQMKKKKRRGEGGGEEEEGYQ
jgi:hypothetical protein